MRITTEGKEVHYGVTGAGTFYQLTTSKKGALVRATRNVAHLLRMMLQPDVTTKPEPIPVQRCMTCPTNVVPGKGQSFEGRVFCNCCIDRERHIEHFRYKERLDDRVIWTIINNPHDI